LIMIEKKELTWSSSIWIIHWVFYDLLSVEFRRYGLTYLLNFVKLHKFSQNIRTISCKLQFYYLNIFNKEMLIISLQVLIQREWRLFWIVPEKKVLFIFLHYWSSLLYLRFHSIFKLGMMNRQAS
jgi:hypothetical protein